MPPKKKGGAKKKSAKPTWMSEEMYDLSQNLPKLQEFWSGDIKESKGKAGDKPPPNITRTQAGLFLWQAIFPNNKATMEKREECIKLGVVETSVKIMASQKPADMVSAAGILAVMASTFDQSRQVMIDSKPAVIPQLLNGLATHDSAPLKAAICSLLRVIATNDDTRPRLWRQLKEWDWSPLIACLRLQEMSALGGRDASRDALQAMDALCAVETEAGTAACNQVIAHGGVQAVVHVLNDRLAHPMARAYGLSVLNQIMRRSSVHVCENVVVGAGGLQPLVSLLDHPIVPLMYKAHAAAVLLRFILPDALWKDSSALSGGARRPKTAPAAAAAAAPAAAQQAAAPPQGVEGAAGPSGAGAAGGVPQVGAPAVPSIADAGAVAPGAAGAAALGSKMDALKLAVNHGMEGHGRPGTTGSMGAGQVVAEPAVPDDHLLDAATKADIQARARLVAEAGAIRALVALCVGPEGPLPDLEAKAAAAAAAAAAGVALVEEKKKKGAKKKAGGKKKGKLEAGMAEAQTWGSAVLRMISLDTDWRVAVSAAGAIRYLLPLLDSKIHPARWNARQTLINLSMTPQLMGVLQLYKVPDYIHGGNIPQRHFDRPFPPTGIVDEGLMQIPAHLNTAVAAAQKDIGAGKGGAGASQALSKPPALKPAPGGR